MRIAIAQFTPSATPNENLYTVLGTIEKASQDAVDLLIFPEATMKAFNSGRLDKAAEPLDGPFATAVIDAAKKAQLTVVLGMFRPADTVTRDGKTYNRIYNSLLCAGPGNSVEHYDKIHLFDAFGFRESDAVAPGNTRVVVDIPVRSRSTTPGGIGPLITKVPGSDAELDNKNHNAADTGLDRTTDAGDIVTIGLATCFDVRFPEHFVSLSEMGAEVIVLPASWNDGPGKLTQWQTLTAARALDSTCYVAAAGTAKPGGAAAAGHADGPTGLGHSAIYGPDGAPRISAGYEPQLLIADIDVEDLARVRKEIPVLEIRSERE